jgi:1-phosphofructokinase family hexose kinase
MERGHVAVLCANPALDVEWLVDGLREEERNRVLQERRWAGGKGVNVARWLRYLGVRTRLVLPVGGDTGAELLGLLRREMLASEACEIHGATRVNVVITTPAGRQWRFNREGPTLRRGEWQAVVKQFVASMEGASLAVLSGSLPPGVNRDAYADLFGRARACGVPTVLDCEGEALRKALTAGPFLVKVNQAELADWWGRELVDEAEVLEAAASMTEAGAEWVLVTRGPEPVLLIQRGQGLRIRRPVPRVRVRNRLGAGDALMAGLCCGLVKGRAEEEWVAMGIDTAAVFLRSEPGRRPPAPALKRLRARLGRARDGA